MAEKAHGYLFARGPVLLKRASLFYMKDCSFCAPPSCEGGFFHPCFLMLYRNGYLYDEAFFNQKVFDEKFDGIFFKKRNFNIF